MVSISSSLLISDFSISSELSLTSGSAISAFGSFSSLAALSSTFEVSSLPSSTSSRGLDPRLPEFPVEDLTLTTATSELLAEAVGSSLTAVLA
ncbi:hypothetical protein N779_12245 [Vibrio coralliilyticus OCN008]|nr:hypothetical protein N779_12245 [Vibrio coralliilyticus OCN008]